MSIAERFRSNREESELTIEQVADTLGVPEFLVQYIENPSAPNPELEEVLSKALSISAGEFRGEVRRATKEERQDSRAAYPAVRLFIIDPERCENVPIARELFGQQELSLPERNLVQYLCSNALYAFCNTNSSAFGFDDYLFRIHASLLARLESHLESTTLGEDERDERRAAGRSNVFACENIENIAILVFDKFVAELEKKLSTGEHGWEEEAGVPFTWRVDRDLMQIIIKDSKGAEIERLRLLDIKARKQ